MIKLFLRLILKSIILVSFVIGYLIEKILFFNVKNCK